MENRPGHLQPIFLRHHVALAYLFGSMAEPARRFLEGGPHEAPDPLADIDVGVVLEAICISGRVGHGTGGVLYASMTEKCPNRSHRLFD